MEGLKKIVSRQDAYFKLSPSTSNETSINLANDIATYISDESGEVTFTLYREDFIQALCSLCLTPNIYYKKESTPTKAQEIFSELSKQVNAQFDNKDKVTYSVYLFIRNDGRNYLNNLKQSNGFNLRSFLIEKFSTLHFIKNSSGEITIRLETSFTEDSDFTKLNQPLYFGDNVTAPSSRQIIYYGAPGTGKSHTIKDETKDEDVVRTTFHPDTDYSTFVGAYKPTTIEEVRTTVIGTRAVPVENPDGSVCTQTKIVYDFVMQSFLQAYVNAWKKYAVQTLEQTEPARQFLIIEEINRGNCAQIFGDLFQLLDRNEYGFSEYPIHADADMRRQLAKTFDGLNIGMADDINAIYNGKDIVGQVLRGDILLLPNNLYIWATMNTSDQSLFPIDSAFKRRWDWKYMPISNANKGWTIAVNGSTYDWWQFVEAINKEIDSTTHSEDKKLGYFFCKADNGVINAERFVGKVIFYIWNDVFKDYDYENAIFNNGDKKIAFHEFYTADGNNSIVAEPMVAKFLANLGVSPKNGEVAEEDDEQPDNSPVEQGTVIKVNGQQIQKYNALAFTAVSEYVKLNPTKTADEVAAAWKQFVSCNPTSWFIVTEPERAELSSRYANYSYEIKCADGKSVWVNKDGWKRETEKNPRDTVKELMVAVNAKPELGITITIENV